MPNAFFIGENTKLFSESHLAIKDFIKMSFWTLFIAKGKKKVHKEVIN